MRSDCLRASSAARARWIEAGPSDPSRCLHGACTARAPACRRAATSRPRPSSRRRHRCGRRSPPVPRSACTLSSGMPSSPRRLRREMRLLRSGPDDLAVRGHRPPQRRAHAGVRLERELVLRPMTRAADANAASTSPIGLPPSRLLTERCGCGCRDSVYPRRAPSTSDQSPGASGGLDRFHSFRRRRRR